MALQTYWTKRRFGITPEPRGKTGKRGGNAFVIQKHAATRLHYDLRLELDGVMKSWAVTRGPSLVPGEKRLAVHVEDHPIEYNKFEGTIPQGQYGGGTVMIWDRGTWEPEGDAHRGYKKGHLNFRLEGTKLHGSWHLVRMHKRPGEKRENWLLIKSDDDFARSAKDPDILEQEDLSAATGRSMDEIAGAEGAVWHSNRPVKENAAGLKRVSRAKPAQKIAKKTSRTKPKAAPRARNGKGISKAKAGKRKAKTKKAKAEPVPGARRTPLPDFVPPCLALLGVTAPDSADWIHEIKFDGYRMQARVDNGKARLLTRKALDWTDKFAPIADALETLPVEQAILDGEIVSENDDGVATFSQLQQDLKEGRSENFVYYVFDLLHQDGYDLTAVPLETRKQALADLLAGSDLRQVRLSEHFTESGTTLLKHACKIGLEGIISKRRSAPYRPGRGGDWIKTKCSDRQEFVVAGYAPSTVDPRAIGALILAYNRDGKLHYAGRVGTGYTHKMARELWTKLQPLRRDKPPFATAPVEETRARNAKWVEPKLVAEVDLRGWTHGERVRQASFQGLREDKSAQEVVREFKAMVTANGPRRTAAKRVAAKAAVKKPVANKTATAGVTLSNPDRVYWEDAGVTKQDLADFYTRIWKWMAPHVTGRVLALLRCPEGAAGECFFQKHASAGVDQKRLHLVAEPDGDKAISVDGLEGVIALVQAGVLEIHTRGSSIDHLEQADRLVFDLDPGPGIGWKDIVAAAREVRERLAALELKAFLKTTGGKGLHVVLPIRPTPWDEAKDFCRRVAEQMSTDTPGRFTATVKKSARGNRIFVDYLRNSREATAVAPYSTRARPGAPVSVPIAWEELNTLKSASQYTVLNLPQRLSRLRADPWKGIGKLKQALPDPKRMRR
ncbi:MAG TPA: DNA ligase D [Xanthobacteraceae bacterium]|nr:DNA ligase D [Xanthobacteraceae bacterium]